MFLFHFPEFERRIFSAYNKLHFQKEIKNARINLFRGSNPVPLETLLTVVSYVVRDNILNRLSLLFYPAEQPRVHSRNDAATRRHIYEKPEGEQNQLKVLSVRGGRNVNQRQQQQRQPFFD